MPHGELTADNVLASTSWFTAGDVRADVAGPGQSTVVDQDLTADDLLAFVSAFFAGW